MTSKRGLNPAGGSRSATPLWRLAAAAPAFISLAACETFPHMKVGSFKSENDGTAAPSAAPAGSQTSGQRTTRIDRLVGPTASPAISGVVDNGPETVAQIATMFGEEKVSATLPPQTVPQFIDTVFNDILKVPYSTGPGVAEMRQVVTLRGSVDVEKRVFFAMVEMALRDYGVSAVIDNGVVRLTRNDSLMTGAPLIVRSRSTPDIPDASRAVIQFFELQSVDANNVKALLDETYPNLGGVKIAVRQDINTLVLTGRAREVAAAAQIITEIDQPRMAGAQISRVEPVYWSAERLAATVSTALGNEGFLANASGSGSIARAVNFMAVPFTNQLLVFSSSPQAFERAIYWIRELDRPAALGDQVQVFIYEVRNMSAEQLGRIAAGVSGEAATVVSAPGGRSFGNDSEQGQSRQAQMQAPLQSAASPPAAPGGPGRGGPSVPASPSTPAAIASSIAGRPANSNAPATCLNNSTRRRCKS